jgi:cytoskeletal protein CcmA (bactofilin family)
MFKNNRNDHVEQSEPTIETKVEDKEPEAPAQQIATRSVSYVGPGMHFTGEITADEGLVIEGEVEGKITSSDKNLTVGKKGQVKGDIIGNVIEVRGSIEGEIFSYELVHLYSSAVIEGTISCKRLVMDEGAQFNGSIDMNWDGSVSQKEPLKSVESDEKVVKVAG